MEKGPRSEGQPPQCAVRHTFGLRAAPLHLPIRIPPVDGVGEASQACTVQLFALDRRAGEALKAEGVLVGEVSGNA